MKAKILPALTIVLALSTLVLAFKVWNMKWQTIYEKAVPDVELSNNLNFDSNGIASGSATGFVVFDDKTKQPKDLRQYEQITALPTFKEGKQVFYITDIIKLNLLAPRYFDPVELTVSNIEGGEITLTDGHNNSYIIDENTKEISLFDSTRDVTKLITSDSDFKDFMISFLK